MPPPPRFRAPVGGIRNVSLTDPVKRRIRGDTAAREAGLRYEWKVQEALAALWPKYHASPLLQFYDDSGYRCCVPDGLLLTPRRVYVFEIKIQHMPEAWWQLKRLYEPVVRAYLFGVPVQCVEVVRSYDPAMPFPTSVELVSDPKEIFDVLEGRFVVLHWKL